jgi:hypothetical protein
MDKDTGGGRRYFAVFVSTTVKRFEDCGVIWNELDSKILKTLTECNHYAKPSKFRGSCEKTEATAS